MDIQIERAKNGFICRIDDETFVFDNDRLLLNEIYQKVGALHGLQGMVTIDYYDRDSKSLRECIEMCHKDGGRYHRIRPANWQGTGLWLAPVYAHEDGIHVGFEFEVDRCEDYARGSGPWVIEDYDPEDYHSPVDR